MFAFLISSFILLLALFVFLIKIWAISSKIVFLIPSLIISLTSIIYYFIGTPSPNAMQIVTSSDNAKLTENLLISQELPEPVLSKSELKILIKRLESRLEINPNNINGWILLARTYINQQDFSKGIVVLKKSLKLLPEKPDLMAELADAMMSRGSNETIHDKPLGLLKRSLEIDPNHQKSLALMATYLMSSKQNEKSIYYSKYHSRAKEKSSIKY